MFTICCHSNRVGLDGKVKASSNRVRNVGDIKSEFYWRKHGFRSLVQLQSGDSGRHESVFMSY